MLCHGSGILQNTIHRIQPLPESHSLGKAHINAFRYFGGVTDTVLYDNMKTVALSREGNRIHWNPQFMDFASHYGFMPKLPSYTLMGSWLTKKRISHDLEGYSAQSTVIL